VVVVIVVDARYCFKPSGEKQHYLTFPNRLSMKIGQAASSSITTRNGKLKFMMAFNTYLCALMNRLIIVFGLSLFSVPEGLDRKLI